MAKIRTQRGYRFVKELGGAIRHNSVSAGAKRLVEQGQLKGRVLDYGCGHGFDADHFGWDAFDPYYRPAEMTGTYDTIICNHVLNMLTRASREQAVRKIQNMLVPRGNAYLIVPRNIPVTGKVGLRKRLQNYVVLTLPSLYVDDQLEIYHLGLQSEFEDITKEIEKRLG